MNASLLELQTPATWPADGGLPDPDSGLLLNTTVPVSHLLLDPGAELASPQLDPAAANADFIRAFAPLRSYRRLGDSAPAGLVSAMATNPAMIEGRVLVRREGGAAGPANQYVVIDGAPFVAALRLLAENQSGQREGVSPAIALLAEHCPVTVVQPSASAALVLSLLADLPCRRVDPWMHGQRDRLLGQLSNEPMGHRSADVDTAIGSNALVWRRYRAYCALRQMMQRHDLPAEVAADLFEVFYDAVARPIIRAEFEWDDDCCNFRNIDALEHLYRLLLPSARLDGIERPASLKTGSDVAVLCDVLRQPAGRAALFEGAALAEAVEIAARGEVHHANYQVSEAIETLRWDQRRLRSRF